MGPAFDWEKHGFENGFESRRWNFVIALVLAVAAAIAAVWYSDAQRIAKLRQEEQRQQERAKRELAKRPPPLPELPPAIDAKEVARIRAAAIAQPPRGKKSEYSWEQIEAILDDLRKQRANRPQAGIDLEQWYEYLALPEFTGTNDADMHMAELMAWQNAMPTSSTPLVVKARFFILVGWQARGSGFSPTVTSEGAIVFRGALAKAQKRWAKRPNWALRTARLTPP